MIDPRIATYNAGTEQAGRGWREFLIHWRSLAAIADEEYGFVWEWGGGGRREGTHVMQGRSCYDGI